jgi:hypothetical protein
MRQYSIYTVAIRSDELMHTHSHPCSCPVRLCCCSGLLVRPSLLSTTRLSACIVLIVSVFRACRLVGSLTEQTAMQSGQARHNGRDMCLAQPSLLSVRAKSQNQSRQCTICFRYDIRSSPLRYIYTLTEGPITAGNFVWANQKLERSLVMRGRLATRTSRGRATTG